MKRNRRGMGRPGKRRARTGNEHADEELTCQHPLLLQETEEAELTQCAEPQNQEKRHDMQRRVIGATSL